MNRKDAFTEEREALSHFALEGEPLSLTPCTAGLINTTFFVHTDRADYVLQKINTRVFERPVEVMANIALVTGHLAAKGLPTLSFLSTREGALFFENKSGVWRVSRRERGKSYDSVTADLFENAARAFGAFQKALSDFDAGRLYETIPDFHNTPKRLAHLMKTAEADPLARASSCRDLLDFCKSRAPAASLLTDGLADGSLPLRVVHNDTKVNNVLFDETGAGLVLDLDTVMPGSILFDFGDAVRSGASTRPEGALDFENIRLDKTLYAAFLKGFLEGADGSLCQKELALLPHSAFVIALELGCRFLDDYLAGDTYFRTTYRGENLDRARGQLILAADIESQLEELSALTERCL